MEEAVTRKGQPLSAFQIELSRAQAEVQAKRISVLHNPIRQQIIKLLEQYPDQLCVLEIATVLSVNLAVLSNHLKILREAGLIKAEHYGQCLYYQINGQALADHRQVISTV